MPSHVGLFFLWSPCTILKTGNRKFFFLSSPLFFFFPSTRVEDSKRWRDFLLLPGHLLSKVRAGLSISSVTHSSRPSCLCLGPLQPEASIIFQNRSLPPLSPVGCSPKSPCHLFLSLELKVGKSNSFPDPACPQLFFLLFSSRKWLGPPPALLPQGLRGVCCPFRE